MPRRTTYLAAEDEPDGGQCIGPLQLRDDRLLRGDAFQSQALLHGGACLRGAEQQSSCSSELQEMAVNNCAPDPAVTESKQLTGARTHQRLSTPQVRVEQHCPRGRTSERSSAATPASQSAPSPRPRRPPLRDSSCRASSSAMAVSCSFGFSARPSGVSRSTRLTPRLPRKQNFQCSGTGRKRVLMVSHSPCVCGGWNVNYSLQSRGHAAKAWAANAT